MFNYQAIKSKYSKYTRWVFILFLALFVLLSCLSYRYIINAQDSSRAWDIPVIELNKVLLDNYSDDYNYTIFDTNNVAYRSKSNLAELYSATNFDIRELVALRPERLLLHEVIVQTLTKWRWSTPNEMRSQIKTVVSNLSKSYQFKNLSVDSAVYRENLNKIMIDAKNIDISNIKKSYKPGRYVRPYSIKQAAIDLHVDYKYKTYIEPRIKNLVTGYYEQIFINNSSNKITVNPAQRPRTIILAGGPASGKSTYGRLMQSKLSHDGIDWRDVVKINTDSYKELLSIQDISHSGIFYSQLVQPEAQIISNYRLKARISEMINQKAIQHVFWDQVLIDPLKIKWGLLNNGMVSIHVVSADTVNSVRRSYIRGQLTGRYEPTEKILNFHKKVTIDLPNIISSFSGENIYISVLDNNISKESVTKIFEVYNAQKYAVIYDSNKLINFISKRNINQKAKSVKDLDQNSTNLNVDDYFSVLATNGYIIVNKN